jgi:hypothetical protein
MRRTRRSAVLAAPTLLSVLLAAGSGHAAPIIGGTTTAKGDFPSVVMIEVGGGLCTGTIIQPTWVLTAAHCVSPAVLQVPDQASVTSSVVVHVGTVNAASDPGTLVKAKNTYPHPGFNINALGSHDVGLIELATPVTNVPLVPVNLVPGNAPIGVTVKMVGFGTYNVDTTKNPPNFQLDGKERLVEQTSVSCASLGANLTAADDANLLCFSQTAGKGKCEGDSGGPSFATVNGKLLEVGVTSFGDQTCAFFGADTRPDAEKAFLLQHIPALQGCMSDAECQAMQAGDVCYDNRCILMPFSPMGLGTTCATNADCESGVCGAGPDGKKCVEGCSTAAGATACPAGFSCLSTGGTGGACWPAAGGSSGGGCCDAGSDGAPTMLVGMMIVGIAFARRRGDR